MSPLSWPVRILGPVAFTSASSGLLLDAQSRLWQTRNGGRTWSEVLSTGTSGGTSLAFSDPRHGFMTIDSFGSDFGNAYVLRTSDGGATWHPQLIAAGTVAARGLVAESAANAFALIDGPGPAGPTPASRLLFFTTSGGDAGTPAALKISTRSTRLTRRRLRGQHGMVTLDGVLTGAQGGEQIVVSRRNLRGGNWQHQTVTAGANGGSFTTSWRIGASSVFVAQWAGDSGRASLGSKVLRVTVR